MGCPEDQSVFEAAGEGGHKETVEWLLRNKGISSKTFKPLLEAVIKGAGRGSPRSVAMGNRRIKTEDLLPAVHGGGTSDAS
jgi:hypothetical protein